MPPDPASEQFRAWARARAGVSTNEQAKPGPTHEEKVADAVAGGADGGARGPEPQRSEHDRLNEAMRDAVLMGGSHRIMHDGVIRERF